MQASTWTHPTTGEQRRYLSGWQEAAGIEVEHYLTGNVRYATYKGEKIANTRAAGLARVKVWLDADNGLHVDGLSPRLAQVGITAKALCADLAPAVAAMRQEA